MPEREWGGGMTTDEFEGRVLRELGDLSTRVAGVEVKLDAYQDRIDSDIRELKGSTRKASDSLTNIEMQTIRAEAIIAKEKWDTVKRLGFEVAKWFAIATLGGIAHVVWGMIHK
jgi:hypothetical protein